MIKLAMLAAAAMQSAPSTQGVWEYRFTEEMICQPGHPYVPSPTRRSIRLDPNEGIYWSCSTADLSGCEEFPAVISANRVRRSFNVAETRLRAVATVGPQLEVVEILTGARSPSIGIFRGRCTVGPPPLRRVD